MKNVSHISALLLLLICTCCTPEITITQTNPDTDIEIPDNNESDDEGSENGGSDNGGSEDGDGGSEIPGVGGMDVPFTTSVLGHKGISYIWDDNVIPEVTINVPLDQWNKLLGLYDQNNHTKEYVHCNVTFNKNGEKTTIEDAGVRLRGNTSRRRPEAHRNDGKHVTNDADWQHCHFGINLRKFNKDDEHEIKGIRKFNLKWFKDDPCYVREVFSYDLFRRAGVWTAAFDSYCKVYVHVEGDSKPAYYGIYGMIEPYDNKYLQKREQWFGSADGNLWKCSYPANLDDENANIGEDDNIHEYTYELKETEGTYSAAKAQLQGFIKNLKKKSGDSFKTWIQEVCDVRLFLRTYAVNVALGMWDDMWNNGNNYYLYFNSLDMEDYKVYLIPYDYDNTLGTSNCYDAAKQDPYNWGNKGLLMKRMMEIPEFREIYRDELKRLIDPQNGLMDPDTAIERVKNWQNKVRPYVSNNTGEDMEIRDKAADWGNWGDYKLTSVRGDKNYFDAKAATINSMK